MQNRYLSAYYFMSNNLCINRQHTRQDMLWMKAHGYDGLHIACDEQHFGLAGVAIQTIIEEAHDVGLDVFAIPSRWCGLIAGWPQGAGHFTASRPDIWMKKEDGSSVIKPFCGPLASVFHPDVKQYMVDLTTRMLEEHNFDGIIWDELKTLHETDYHPKALEANNGQAPARAQQIEQTLSIFAACNQAAKAAKPDLTITSFLYAQLEDDIVKPWASTPGFDEIGLDGHSWRGEVFNHAPHENKSLNDHAERFVAIAKEYHKRSFALIETQGFNKVKAEACLAGLPEFLTMGIDHIACYYHPLVKEQAGEITDIVGPILRDWRLGSDDKSPT